VLAHIVDGGDLMAYQEIICEKEPPIGRIILNEPGKMNPLNWHRLNEVGAAAKGMERDGDIRVIIIKGAGRCFSAGYDITPPTEGGVNFQGNDPL